MFSFRFGIVLLTAALAGATTYNCATYSVPGSTYSYVQGINNAGVMVGYYTAAGSTHGFIWNGSFQTVDFGPTSNYSSYLFGINNSGVSTGQSRLSILPPQNSYTVDPSGAFQQIPNPSPIVVIDEVYGINDNGAIAVGLGGTALALAIRNPDGTLIYLPGSAASMGPGALNNSLQMLESGGGKTNLVDASGNLTPISAGGYTYAYGLNNPGVIAGYFTPGTQSPPQPPFIGFTRDPSGVYSHVFCPGIPLNSPNAPRWQTINDNGVIAGNVSYTSSSDFFYVATPVSGQAQVTLSSTNLAFPPTPVGQTSSPQTVTLTNAGTARLDIAGFEIPAAFQVSGCLDPTTQTASLQPGATCTLSVTATPTAPGVASGIIGIEDSVGLPQQIAVSVTATALPPACQVSSVTSTQATFTMQYGGPGLSSIVLLDSTNANVTIPSFPAGTTNPVNVTATQIDSSTSSKVDFKVTNVSGGATSCGATFGGPSGWTGIGGSFTGKIVTVTNTDGRLQSFARGTDNALWTIAQNSPDGGWTSWQSLGGVLTSDPAAAVNADGRLEIFAVGADGALWHIWQFSFGGPWTNWVSLGGSIVGDPAAIANQDGRLEVFVVGADQALWHIWQTSPGFPWSSWASLGGVIIGNPAVAKNADGRLEAFVLGTDDALWHIAQTAPNSDWGGWSGLGGSLTGDPAPAINSDGRLEVFARGGDNQLWHVWQTTAGGSWASVSALGGVLTSNPAIGRNADGRLEAFVRGTDSALWHIAQASPSAADWSDWATLGGVLANGPATALNQDGRLEAFVAGSDTSFWYIEQPASGFWN